MSLRERLQTLLGEVGLGPGPRTHKPQPAPPKAGFHPSKLSGTDIPLQIDETYESLEDLKGYRLEKTPHGSIPIFEHRIPSKEKVGIHRPSEWMTQSIQGLGQLLDDPRMDQFTIDQALFLDIEATDLNHGAGCTAFLLGLGFFEADGTFVIQQYLQRDPADEMALLYLLVEKLNAYPFLVSYNGKSYDLSVLQNRLIVQRFFAIGEAALKLTPHVDLLHVGRRLWKELLPNCRLGTLEEHILGEPRTDDLPGAMVPSYYFAYRNSTNAAYIKPVLEHNLIDVRSMVGLLTVVMERIIHPNRYAYAEELYEIGRWLYERGFRTKALSLLQRAVRLPMKPQARAKAYRTTLRAYRQQGKSEALLEVLEAYQESFPEIAEPFIELAKYHEHKTRDPNRALELALKGRARVSSSDQATRDEIDHRIRRLEKRIARRSA